MVLGTMAFSISTIGMAAEVQEANGLNSAQQTIASDTARKEAVRSSWMDRTDVVVGVGMKNFEESSSPSMILQLIGPLLLGHLISLSLQNSISYMLRHYNL